MPQQFLLCTLQIYKNGKASHFVNADDPSNSNWMRFVNCSRSEGEQSVQAYQHRGHIYFIAHKAIQPNTEILVGALFFLEDFMLVSWSLVAYYYPISDVA